MNIAFLGYPGSGKGTQARLLAGKLGLVHVSFGDIYWREINKKTPMGQEVSDYLPTGRLVPDWLVFGWLKEKYAAERRGFLFDGFPATTEQAEQLDAWLASRAAALDAVVFLNIPEAEAAKRLGARRVCPGCGAIFNTLTNPPFMENLCDSCGGPLKPQEDDKPEALKKRLMVYRDYTSQLNSYYRGNSAVLEVKADQPPAEVTKQILSVLKTVAR